jgi:hypothetical protein
MTLEEAASHIGEKVVYRAAHSPGRRATSGL